MDLHNLGNEMDNMKDSYEMFIEILKETDGTGRME
jgi:hypothetical protein